jgi:hypothetical protein
MSAVTERVGVHQRREVGDRTAERDLRLVESRTADGGPRVAIKRSTESMPQQYDTVCWYAVQMDFSSKTWAGFGK